MADIANKYAENASGKFYVDDQCGREVCNLVNRKFGQDELR